MAKGLTREARQAGLQWALATLESVADRYPDLGALALRARGTENLLDRFIVEVEKVAAAEGRPEEWKAGLLPSIVSVWMNGAGTESHRRRKDAAQKLDERRDDIIAAADRLRVLLQRNEAQVPSEIGLDLRALPVSVRFPGLLSSLESLAAWARRDALRPTAETNQATKVSLFVQEVDKTLQFQIGHEAMADLWRLLQQEDLSASAVRMARNRAK